MPRSKILTIIVNPFSKQFLPFSFFLFSVKFIKLGYALIGNCGQPIARTCNKICCEYQPRGLYDKIYTAVVISVS